MIHFFDSLKIRNEPADKRTRINCSICYKKRAIGICDQCNILLCLDCFKNEHN